MIFKHTIDKVLSGRKTQTRRRVCGARGPRYAASKGKTLAVQPGRGKHGVGRIKITDWRIEHLIDITLADAIAEGFNTIDEFMEAWETIHGHRSPATLVEVLTFKLAEDDDTSTPSPRRRKRDRRTTHRQLASRRGN